MHRTGEATKAFLGKRSKGQPHSIKGLADIRFWSVLAACVDGLVLAPKAVSPELLDEVHPWTGDHVLERARVTPLRKGREITRLRGRKGGKRSRWDRVLRSNPEPGRMKFKGHRSETQT